MAIRYSLRGKRELVELLTANEHISLLSSVISNE